MIVPTRLHVELVRLLEVWTVALGVDVLCTYRSRLDHDIIQHDEDL